MSATMIGTNEIQQVSVMQDADRFLVDTGEFGTGTLPFHVAAELMKTRLTPAMQAEARGQMDQLNSFESGTVTIANNQPYPFNSGVATVALTTPRRNMNYVISAEVVSVTGNIQSVEVYDKQLNGFKIRYDGAAAAVTVKYYVTGGMN